MALKKIFDAFQNETDAQVQTEWLDWDGADAESHFLQRNTKAPVRGVELK